MCGAVPGLKLPLKPCPKATTPLNTIHLIPRLRKAIQKQWEPTPGAGRAAQMPGSHQTGERCLHHFWHGLWGHVNPAQAALSRHLAQIYTQHCAHSREQSPECPKCSLTQQGSLLGNGTHFWERAGTCACLGFLSHSS